MPERGRYSAQKREQKKQQGHRPQSRLFFRLYINLNLENSVGRLFICVQ